MSKSVQITAESISKALESSKPSSLTGLWKALGGTGSVSGSAAKKMREAVPGIEAILAKNKAGDPVKPEPVAKPGKPKVRKPEEPASTPYRKGSAYSKVYQILMEHPDGISRADLIREAARRCKKPASRSAFDVAVVVSPRESCTGPRHRSARDGYFLEVEGSCLKLRTD